MRRIPLTLRGAGALLLAAACFALAAQVGLVGLQMLGVLLVALVAASVVWVWTVRRAADVARAVAPALPAVGDTVTVRMRMRMRSAAGMPAGLWQDAVPAGLEGTASGAWAAVGSGWRADERTAERTYALRATERGVHLMGPLSVTITDPFGIARRTIELGGQTRLTVTPSPIGLAPTPAPPGRSGGAHPTPSHRYGQGNDDLVARPWAPGDSMRRIHWRATAHRDELMVRQEERETSPEATVVFDLSSERFSPGASAPGGDPRFEVAVTACVSVAARLVHDGFEVAVTDVTGHPLCETIEAGDEAGIERMLLAAAALHVDAGAPLAALAARFAGDVAGPLVLVTGALREEEATALSAVAAHSTLPVLLAIGAEPAVAGAARGWRGGAVTAATGTPDEVWAQLAGPGAADRDRTGSEIAAVWSAAVAGVSPRVA
ncbi:DUF58 domain-containing protein [Microbacterium sp. SORGH_AS_0888]|uniref:DUF58 domain-containing protein n=1 Tax=Microbacterium sp. SORGH_AS_0888 TaxID=3041791 RepID=UPI002784F594|nr:DUF58 domain-containing protein [Microbacterium sp. SORGH_AS_0888]MDQ1130829.1 uncharacterized protein (DUF58 family) [Microbacterium sp. SORGH_AS_0888]